MWIVEKSANITPDGIASLTVSVGVLPRCPGAFHGLRKPPQVAGNAVRLAAASGVGVLALWRVDDASAVTASVVRLAVQMVNGVAEVIQRIGRQNQCRHRTLGPAVVCRVGGRHWRTSGTVLPLLAI
jgi:hypothetical protein